MSLKTISQVKNQKPFLKMDIIVYALLAVLILTLFIVFVFSPRDTSLQKIQVFHYTKIGSAKLIYEYDFATQKGDIIDKDYKNKIIITKEGQDTLVKFVTDDGHFNLLKISLTSAKMIEADCSKSKECVNNFGAITGDGDFIICTVHDLKVVGIGKIKNDDIISGLLEVNK